MPAPSWANAWAQARSITDPAVELLTITHPGLGAPLRVAKYPTDIVSREDTFTAGYFESAMVTDDDGPPRSSVSIPNLNGALGRVVDSLPLSAGPLEVILEVVSLANLDVPVFRAARLRLTDVTVNPMFVTGNLTGLDYSSEPVGTVRVAPPKFPSLFRH